jgi:hypothetical protein
VRTVIVRLSEPSGDGELHGLVEFLGRDRPAPFVDDAGLLRLLHEEHGPSGAERAGAQGWEPA